MKIKDSFDELEIHKFNQYLYDNGINLPKSQKTLFVASILLTLKVDSSFLDGYDLEKPGFLIANKMLELIQQGYNDEVFTNQFSFIKKSLNNKHLYDLTNKLSIDVKKYGKDILNKFYHEFCKWDKNDDSKLGVVLTPHDIVELMIKELEIKESDSLLDFCTGTGSFLIEGSKYTPHLIGCENNEERYSLSKCNFILNDLDFSRLYFNSCFNKEFEKVDKSIINPPFSCKIPDELVIENSTNWKDFDKEQKFILYQLQCLKDGGIGCCIVPRSNFNNSIKKTNEFKKEFLKHAKILKIICCNSKIFYPVASVECSILIYKKIKNENVEELEETKIIDFSDDGYNVKKNERIKIGDPNPKEQKRILKFDDDWNFKKEFEIPDDIKKLILLYNINYNYSYNLSRINKGLLSIENNYPINIDIVKWEKLRIGDYFEIIKTNKIFQIQSSNEGEYPLIGSSSMNNGVLKYINHYDYDGDYISVARTGSTGSTFYQSGKFSIDTYIKLLKPLENNNISLHIWSMMMNHFLQKKYSYSSTITNSKLLDEVIYIPRAFEKSAILNVLQ